MMPSLNDIKRLREKLSLTQNQLSKLTGFSQSYIARVERGEINPSFESTKKIFEVLNNEIMNSEGKVKRAKEIMSDNIVSVQSSDRFNKAVKKLYQYGFSQLPVIDNGIPVGSITDNIVRDSFNEGEKMEDLKKLYVREIMEEPFPQVSENTPVKVLSYLLMQYEAVLIGKEGTVSGIVTKTDLLKVL